MKLYVIIDIHQNATYCSSYDKAVHHFQAQIVEYKDALLMHFPYRPFMIEYEDNDGIFEESTVLSYEEFCKRI
jgi:calcineurin-like phosphoesterase family protein